jgi:hypothetical protein
VTSDADGDPPDRLAVGAVQVACSCWVLVTVVRDNYALTATVKRLATSPAACRPSPLSTR